uniref:UDENN FLCN/SMCR8-type domain-containing protein n=1 Tax=Anisakis simplex TaxID=6269 RepID=A0A0M3JWE7_ANISI
LLKNQVQGPRPLYRIPKSANPHLDLDSVAIWLMSSEVVSGSTIVVYNQQMAVHACVHHSTILDIRARGFQRQLSLALLSAVKPTASVLKLFIDVARQLLSPILACNRRLFKERLSQLIDLSDSMQRSTFNNYYALYSDLMLSPTSVARIESVAVQARRLLPRFQAAYNSISNSKSENCSRHRIDDVEECLGAIGNPHAPLLPINDLAPCTFDKFVKSLAKSRELFVNKPSTAAASSTKNGAMFCAQTPILRLSHFSTPPPICPNNLLSLLSDDYEDKEESLKAIISNLNNILYAMFSGEKIAVCASKQRQITAMDLLKKLILVRVSVQRHGLIWNDSPFIIPQDCQLFGQSVSREESAKWKADGVNVIVDLNGHTIRCKQYNGAVLRSLAKKRTDSFPTDRSLIAYLVSLLTDFCMLVYMAKHEDVRKLSQLLTLTTADINMLANFLVEIDFLRYVRVKDDFIRSDKTASKNIKL